MKPFNRTIRLHDLATHIDEALEFEPSLLLREFCGAYYSPYYLFMNHMANRLSENGLLVELAETFCISKYFLFRLIGITCCAVLLTAKVPLWSVNDTFSAAVTMMPFAPVNAKE